MNNRSIESSCINENGRVSSSEESTRQDAQSESLGMPIKRLRGRPRKHAIVDVATVKRGRGRPRKYPMQDVKVKRSRGRPRKYDVMEKEQMHNGEYKPVIKKVDSGHLLQQMYNYFTKLMIIHSQLSKEDGKYEALFSRLKTLDFQMAEVCKTVLSREYLDADVEKVAE